MKQTSHTKMMFTVNNDELQLVLYHQRIVSHHLLKVNTQEKKFKSTVCGQKSSFDTVMP